ncbi:MAG: TatD family hydrolase [Deltaproteobacteria bacterium]|nr:TatD family hydrolase [Deltaproteobacteria bacterium]
MNIDLIDTHCHLGALDAEEADRVVNDAKLASVNRMVCIGAGDGADSARHSVALAERNPAVWASVGIHPHDADKAQLSDVASLLTHPRVVALGECGLDYFRDWSPVEDQRRLFRESITLAHQFGKKLIIHCRAAEDETLTTLREMEADKIGGVFHCFSGDVSFAERVLEIGFHISITGTVTFKNAEKLRDVVRFVPLDRLMLETDTPYMAPEPYRGTPSEPKHVFEIARKVAMVRDDSIANIAAQTTANAVRFFGL